MVLSLRKIGGNVKKFFSKNTEDKIVGGLKKIPQVLETGLRKTGSTLEQSAPIIDKIGKVAGMVAPELASVPLVGVPLASGAMALSASAPALSRGVRKTGNLLENVRKETKSGVQAPKPQKEEYNAFDELPFA